MQCYMKMYEIIRDYNGLHLFQGLGGPGTLLLIGNALRFSEGPLQRKVDVTQVDGTQVETWWM